MSAFVVEDKTINRVVSFLHNQHHLSNYHLKIKESFGLDLLSEEDCEKLARSMFETNCRSVRARYADADEAEMIPREFVYSYELRTPPIQVYKSLRCWLYQCSEGDIPETSALYQGMRKLASLYAKEIVEASKDYEKADWD